jgi:hypothetical protein
MSKTREDSGVRGGAHTFTAGRGSDTPARDTPVRGAPRPRAGTAARPNSRARGVLRRVVQRIAVLVALLILFYATSLHGVSARTFVLAGLLVLSLYWIFKGWL